MNLTERETVKIKLDGIPGVGHSGSVVTFIFTNLCFIFWGNMMGFFGEGAGLTIGAIQLGVSVSYHVAAILLYLRKEEFDANVFLVFATFFGGVGGATNIAGALATAHAIPFDGRVTGVCWILCGLYLFCILPGCRNAPWTAFVMYLLCAVGVFGMGLQTVGLTGDWLTTINEWTLFGGGVFGFFFVFATMCGFSGINIPLGRPLMKPKT